MDENRNFGVLGSSPKSVDCATGQRPDAEISRVLHVVNFIGKRQWAGTRVYRKFRCLADKSRSRDSDVPGIRYRRYRSEPDRYQSILGGVGHEFSEVECVFFGALMKFFGVVILGLLAVQVYVQAAKQEKVPAAQKETSPLTVIPLDDAAKVRVLSLLRQQDKLIIERRDRQLRITELDKQIAEIDKQINQMANDLAEQGKINVNQLVLDLDKLAWVSKEMPK